MASPIQKVLTWFSKSFSRKARQLSDTILTAIMAGRDSSDEHQTRGIVESSWAALKFTDFLKRAVHRSIKVSFEQHGQKAPKLLPELEDVWDESGMTLSQKLHGADKEMRDKIVETIKAQQKQNAHAMQVARALYDGYNADHVTRRQLLPKYLSDIVIFARRSDLTNEDRLALLAKVRKTQRLVNRLGQNGAPNKALRSAYTGILEAVEKDSEKALERAVKTAIEEKSRYVAERIARTEAARAWADGFLARYGDDDSVVAYQWKLASRHPEFDICDLYAEADLWGLGKGIYPKDKTSMLPVHPHCLCHLAPVYRSELEGKKPVNRLERGGREYLKSLSPHQRQRILGIQGYKAVQSGVSWTKKARNYTGKVLDGRLRNIPDSLKPYVKDGTIKIKEVSKRQDGESEAEFKQRIWDYIKSPYCTKEFTTRQDIHIKGTKTFNPSKSYYNDASDIPIEKVRKWMMDGELALNKDKSSWLKKIRIRHKGVIGILARIDGTKLPTESGMIHVGDKGIHLLPRKEDS